MDTRTKFDFSHKPKISSMFSFKPLVMSVLSALEFEKSKPVATTLLL